MCYDHLNFISYIKNAVSLTNTLSNVPGDKETNSELELLQGLITRAQDDEDIALQEVHSAIGILNRIFSDYPALAGELNFWGHADKLIHTLMSAAVFGNNPPNPVQQLHPGVFELSDRILLVLSGKLGLEQTNITNVTTCLLQENYRDYIQGWVGGADAIVLFRSPTARAMVHLLGHAGKSLEWYGYLKDPSMGEDDWDGTLSFWPCQDWSAFLPPDFENNRLGLRSSNFNEIWDKAGPIFPNPQELTVSIAGEIFSNTGEKLIFCPGSGPDLHPYAGFTIPKQNQAAWVLSNWELLLPQHRTPQEWAGDRPVVFVSAASGTTAIRICLASFKQSITYDPFEHLAKLIKEKAPSLFKACQFLVQKYIHDLGHNPQDQKPNTMNSEAWQLLTSGTYDQELKQLDSALFDEGSTLFDLDYRLIIHAASEIPFDPKSSCPFKDMSAPLYSIIAHRLLTKLNDAKNLLMISDKTWNVKKVLDAEPDEKGLICAHVFLSKIERNQPLDHISDTDKGFNVGIFKWDKNDGLSLEENRIEIQEEIPTISCVAASYGLSRKALPVNILSATTLEEQQKYYAALVPEEASD